MSDGMLDIETLGKKSGCIILSIGCVGFDPRGNGYGERFYANIDRASCEAVGLVTDPDTLNWWASQPEQAKQALLPNQMPLQSALYEFVNFWHRNALVNVWAQGSNFDVPIIEAAFQACGIIPPWDFWAVRDTRTAYELCGFDPSTIKREGTYHKADDDAIHQIRCVQTAIHQLNKVVVQQ